jgi:lysophospholipase L1-like esterase
MKRLIANLPKMFFQRLNRRSMISLLTIGALSLTATIVVADDPRPVVDDSKTPLETRAQPELPTLYVVGDSTARSDAPLRGWGSEIGAFFDPSKINVVNRAIGGRSSRTFITEGRWDKVLADLKPGDFVLVQFGHNDVGDYHDPKAKGRPSIRGEGDDTAETFKSDLKTTETIHTFGWYLRKYSSEAKAKGATVILLSMVPHKDWKGGKITRKEQDTFVKWTAHAAEKTGAQFIDANNIIAEGLERLGEEKVKSFFGDARTHSTPEGAKYNAAAIVFGMKQLKPNPLANYFSKLADDLPPTLSVSAPENSSNTKPTN